MLGILALVPLIPGSLSESECANLADKWGEMHFQTIRKFMHPESSEEVTIEFCWIVTSRCTTSGTSGYIGCQSARRALR